jgi:EAL domain-containing protein (putative c-di-GMP-specific phosphodiesterase class I)
LRSLGCEYGQGYFFAKPLAPEEVDTLLASGRRW